MKTIAYTALTLLFLLGSIPSTALAEPGLRIIGSHYDFGYTPQNSTVHQYFWFNSTGTDTLRIKEIKTGCTCALMPLERDWIAPADSMRVGIIWETGRTIGSWARYPRVFTNISDDPTRMQVTGNVFLSMGNAKPVTIKPFRLEVARTDDLSIDSLAFVLTNTSGADLTVVAISEPMDECRLQLPEIIPAGMSAEAMLWIMPEYLEKEFETSVTLEFSDNQKTHITVPVRRKFYLSKNSSTP